MKRVATILLSLILALSLASGICFAAPMTASANKDIQNVLTVKTPAKKAGFHTSYVNTRQLKLLNPARNTVYYKGEKISGQVLVADVWDNYWTCPGVVLIRESDGKIMGYVYSENPVTVGKRDVYDFQFLTKNITSGKYLLHAAVCPVDEDKNLPDDFDNWGDEDIPNYDRPVYVKTLLAPKRVRAIAGFKKVGVTFKKATGAKQYRIYRSTKKKSGYKLIATTSKTRYVDKTVKRHKTYYYKVKSVRNVRGTVKSAYSSRVLARAW